MVLEVWEVLHKYVALVADILRGIVAPAHKIVSDPRFTIGLSITVIFLVSMLVQLPLVMVTERAESLTTLIKGSVSPEAHI